MNTVPYEITLSLPTDSQADFVLTDSSTTHFTSTHFEIVQTQQSFFISSTSIIIDFLAVATDQTLQLNSQCISRAPRLSLQTSTHFTIIIIRTIILYYLWIVLLNFKYNTCKYYYGLAVA